MKVFVGLSSFRGNIRRFGFDVLELAVSPTLAKPKTLAEYRAARPDVAFAFRLDPSVVGTPTHPDRARVVLAAKATEASVIVIPTSPGFSPTERNRALLSGLIDELRGSVKHIAWEPRGIFHRAEAERWATELGVVLVRDLAQEGRAAGPVVYTRLLPLGFGARVTQSALEHVAERLEGADEAYVIIQGEGARGGACTSS